MYVLNSITEFYEAYKNEKELYYGKQLRFIPKKENFIESSQKMFDYIIKYAEMVEYNSKYNEYGSSNHFKKKVRGNGRQAQSPVRPGE